MLSKSNTILCKMGMSLFRRPARLRRRKREKTGTTAAQTASSPAIALVRQQGWPTKKWQHPHRWSLSCRLGNGGNSPQRRRETMRFKTSWIALALLMSLIAGTLLMAQGHAAAFQTHRHSAAWYRTHQRHNAAWYRRHRRYSEEWYE